MLAMTSVVAVPCRICQETTELNVSVQGLVNWKSGELIQDALPELSCGERELLISGTCGTCFDELFPSEDE